MLPAPFSVTFDHEQTRPQIPSVFINVRGTDTDFTLSSDVWVDPVTKTMMLMPMGVYPEYFYTNTGIHAKPAKSAYEFTTSGNWDETEWASGGGKWLRTHTAGEYARTATAPGKNQGIVFSFVNYGGGDLGGLYEFGWDDTATDDTATLYFSLNASGRIDCYKNGTFLKSVNISLPTGTAAITELLMLPMRTRELLIYCHTTGSGAVLVFEDIDEGATTFEITPNEKFFAVPNSNATVAQLIIDPCAFETSGYATSDVVTFSRPPRTGATLRTATNPVFTSVTNANVYGAKAGAGTTDVSSIGVYEDDGTTSYTPDGTIETCRLRTTFSGDGSYTPFAYGVSAEYTGTTDVTDDSEAYSPDDWLTGLSLDVPDSAFESKVSLGMKLDIGTGGTPSLLTSHIANFKVLRNRPVKLEVDTLLLVDGWSLPPRFVDNLTEASQRVTVDVRDMTRVMDFYVFRDEIPFDGYQLSKPATGSNYSVVEYILEACGLSRSQMSLSDASFLVPEVPGKTSGEWGYAVRPGDTARSFLEQLLDEFAADWFMGVRPTASGPVFCFWSPSDMPSTAVIKLYRSKDDAESDGVDSSVSKQYVAMSYDTTPEEVDANLIFATGLDPRSEQVVQSYTIDSSSTDCTTAPSVRPDNWVGMERPFGVFDPRLRTTTDTDKTVELLANVVGASRTIGEFKTNTMLWYNSDPGGTDVMLPVWRGDLVTIDGVGDVRITSMSVRAVCNDSDNLVTEATYTFGGFTHSGGSSLATIQGKNNAKRARGLFDLRRNPFALGPVKQTRRSSV